MSEQINIGKSEIQLEVCDPFWDTWSKNPKHNVEDSYFRLQNNRLFLTYKTHLNKAEFKTWFNSKFKGTKELEMAHETGNENVPYEHTHVLVHFGRMFKSQNCRIFDKGDIHPNIRKVLSNTHWDNLLNYLAKEDPENAHLKRKPSIVIKIWGYDSIQDALTGCVQKPSDALGVVSLWEHRPKKEIEVNPLIWKWQFDLFEFLKSKPNGRGILWYYDSITSMGKTDFTRYMFANYPDDYLAVSTLGGVRDFATIIEGAIDRGWTSHCLIIDLPRDCQNKSIYEPLETALNGFSTSTKYRGKSTLLNKPHVVVFANFLPCCSRMSPNRWVPPFGAIYNMLKDGNVELINPNRIINGELSVLTVVPPINNKCVNLNSMYNYPPSEVEHINRTIEQDHLCYLKANNNKPIIQTMIDENLLETEKELIRKYGTEEELISWNGTA